MYQYESNRESHEYFHPSPTNNTRRASAKSSVFNLVSTIIGGGILSLPYAFSKCGLILAIVFMIITAATSGFSVYLLVSCSKRSGAQSYEDVTYHAFGRTLQFVTMGLVILLTFFSFVAYLILTRDLASSLFNIHNEYERNALTVCCLALISPVLFFKTLHALRFTSIFSLCTILILAIGISIRAFEKMQSVSYQNASIQWWPKVWSDALYAFPIISVAFLCHFNVLPIHSELHQPTRKRLKIIVYATMCSAWFFYMIVGIMGYLVSFTDKNGVPDDILIIFKSNDVLINVWRCGLLMTVLLSLPLLLMPCRTTVFRFISESRKVLHPVPETIALLSKTTKIVHNTNEIPSTFMHITMTIILVLSALVVAFNIPGVSDVWSMLGSTVGILVSYVLPSISYIRIRKTKSNLDLRKFAAWIVFIASIIALCVCTVQAISNLRKLLRLHTPY